ncbi:MAG: hypothetical protein RPR98_03055 [Bermanella sp.]
MSDTATPAFLKDSAQILTQAGFASSQTWYHGTASGLLASILRQGLKQSGDSESNQKAKNTMTTIGGSYKENKDPVFLTQSKELAYYWASQACHARNKYFAQDEAPVVLAIKLPAELNNTIQPDVGVAAILLAGQNDYLDAVNKIYQDNALQAPQIDPMTADRMDYLKLLGMAYSQQNIAAEYIELVNP